MNPLNGQILSTPWPWPVTAKERAASPLWPVSGVSNKHYIGYDYFIEPVPKQLPSLQWTEDGPRGLLVCKQSTWVPPSNEPIRIASFDLVIKP
jgi:hypothetical protein